MWVEASYLNSINEGSGLWAPGSGGRLTVEALVKSSLRAASAAALLVLTAASGHVTAQHDRSAATVSAPADGAATRPEPVDLAAVQRIKDEGLQRSQVMDTAWYLTDVHGPRLTNSPNIRAAAAWAARRLGEWGIANVRQESWGPFGRGW